MVKEGGEGLRKDFLTRATERSPITAGKETSARWIEETSIRGGRVSYSGVSITRKEDRKFLQKVDNQEGKGKLMLQPPAGKR